MRPSGIDAGGGGVGGGSSPGFFGLQYLYVTWLWPANVPNPTGGFDVIFYTGTDPTNTNNYVFSPADHCEPTDRQFQRPCAPGTSLTGVNAAVRAVYA